MSKQTLQLKFKNVPTDTSLVCSSTTLPLNRNERASVVEKVLDCNNPEVNQRKQVSELKAIVPVLSFEGKPLMPCTQTKARHLLERKKAHVVKLNPFIIQLNFICENKVQDISLGIDIGYKTIGFSAITEIEEIMSGEVKLDNKTSERMVIRRICRLKRRCKLRYREPRFNNRTRSENWFPPSIQRKLNTHISLINKLKSFLPITKVIIEIAKFDIQKIENSEISGIGYQQGNLYGYLNVKMFLFNREKGKCQFCRKKIEKGQKVHIHHIKSKNEGGTDRPSNLALLHKNCHEELHEKMLYDKLKFVKSYKTESCILTIGKKLQELIDCEVTFGYITNFRRKSLELEKTHINDAFVIAEGNNQKRCKPLIIEHKRINNRILQVSRKGFKLLSIRRKRYKIQNKDFIWIDGIKYLCGGTKMNGARVYYFKGTIKQDISSKKIEKVYHTNSLVWF